MVHVILSGWRYVLLASVVVPRVVLIVVPRVVLIHDTACSEREGRGENTSGDWRLLVCKIWQLEPPLAIANFPGRNIAKTTQAETGNFSGAI